MFTIGIKLKNTHHVGFLITSSMTIKLYIGTIDAQPGFPAFVKIFHIDTIKRTNTTSMMSGNPRITNPGSCGQATTCPFSLQTDSTAFNEGEKDE